VGVAGWRAGIRPAALASRVAGETTAEERADLAVRVTRAFGGVLQAAARRRAADAAVEAAQEDLARAERRRDAGLATEADVLSLKVFLAQVQEARIRAASGEQVARAQLNRLMGAPLDAVYALAEPPPPSGAGSPEGDDEAAALRSRPMVRRAEAQLALAATSHAAARAAFLPQLHVQGLYETNGNAFGHRAHEWLASGQLRLNLFAGGGDAARLRAAAAAEARAKAERDDALDAARLEVRTARAEYDAAVAREAVGRAAVLQARESQRIIRDRYEAGLVGVTDLLRAASALLDAETLRIASVVDVFVCRAALDRATGRLR
jgi:outer membrane protein TolC